MKSQLKPSLSSVLLLFFALVLVFLGLFAEVFESEIPEVDLAQIYANPVPLNELLRLKSLKMTNKNGPFHLENTHPEGKLEGPWQMIAPQSLKVKNEVIAQILDALNVIRVRNLHQLEPINITSFSLDNPTLTLEFTTIKNKNYEVKVGLINPIDNSAYLGLSSQNQIYQIDPLEMALETYDLAQLAESRVLALNTDSLASLEIYNSHTLKLKILKKEDQWLDQNGLTLTSSKVKNFLNKLEDLKSFSILNNLTAPQQEFMEGAQMAFTLKLISAQGVRSYVISEIKNGIPGMNLTKNDFYALSSDEKKSFVLIDKDQLKMFHQKNMDLQ